jgi:peptidoglycan/xylan/chitin deacetylase (PgdA/CDA1 family)
MYAYDDEPTRRFKTLLNFELPYPVLDVVLRGLTEAFIGNDDEIMPKLYMSADDLRRCQDAGLQIGAHGHQHRVHSRLTDEEQRREMRLSADYFSGTFGLRDMPWSYPWGFAGSWTASTTRLLEESGFSSAATMVRAIVKPSDLRAKWELPRFDVRDVFDDNAALKGDTIRALFSAD